MVTKTYKNHYNVTTSGNNSDDDMYEFEFNIMGYYFKIDSLSDFVSGIFTDLNPSGSTTTVNVGYVTAGIRLKRDTLSGGTEDNAPSVVELKPFTDGSSDTVVESNDNLLDENNVFQGVRFFSSANSFYDTSVNIVPQGCTQHYLQLFKCTRIVNDTTTTYAIDIPSASTVKITIDDGEIL